MYKAEIHKKQLLFSSLPQDLQLVDIHIYILVHDSMQFTYCWFIKTVPDMLRNPSYII